MVYKSHALIHSLKRPRLTLDHSTQDTNFALNLFESAAACTVAAGVTYATAENKDKELDDLQKVGESQQVPQSCQASATQRCQNAKLSVRSITN